MCRIFGCVAAEPVSLRHELLDAPKPLIRQSEHHDSGWGMAVYERAEQVTADEQWHTVEQDVLLVLDPGSRLGEPDAERLLGDELAATARLDPLNQGAELTGEGRGRFAAERAQRIAAGG